jgi:predicted peptidase
MAPICGGGDPGKADRLKSLPIWVFHGDKDEAVPLQRSEEMVSAIRAAGSTTVRFTTLEDVGHNSWSAAYATPELYQWFDKQTRSQNRERAGK